MALTVAATNAAPLNTPIVADGLSHGLKAIAIDCTTGAADYAAGGYAITPATVAALGYQFQNIIGAIVIGHSNNVLSVPVWNHATGKLMFFEQGGAAAGPLREAVAADVTTSTVVRLLVFGF